MKKHPHGHTFCGYVKMYGPLEAQEKAIIDMVLEPLEYSEKLPVNDAMRETYFRRLFEAAVNLRDTLLAREVEKDLLTKP